MSGVESSSISDATKSAAGLAIRVREHLKQVLSVLVPQWQAEPQVDFRRVVRPAGNGLYAISIEPYRGAQAWIGFRKKHHGSELLLQLESAIRKEQPELLGHVVYPSGMGMIQDVFALVSAFCQAVLRYSEKPEEVNSSIDRVLGELDTVIASGTASEVVMTALSGLKLPDEIDAVSLAPGLCIRRLTESEFAEIGSNDISSENRHDITSRFVTTALVSTRQVSLTLSDAPEYSSLDPSHLQERQDHVNAVLSALHLLKSGRVGVVASFITMHPTILPNMSGSSSAPIVINPFSFMELSVADVERLGKIHAKLIENKRDEVKISVARLLDAETRLSPVDSLLDSIIGLEVMLNPNDRDELAFRVALNYAFLGKASERRRRFESIRDIQKVRNRVVHGGLNLQSKDAALIQDSAEAAKACLRDTITRFLEDKELAGNAKLNADFWLDRVIPPESV